MLTALGVIAASLHLVGCSLISMNDPDTNIFWLGISFWTASVCMAAVCIIVEVL